MFNTHSHEAFWDHNSCDHDKPFFNLVIHFILCAMHEMSSYSPSNEITTISEEPLSARGRSPSMSGRAGEGSSVVSPASHARRASAVPVIPTEATGPMGHQRRISSPVGQNYERKITVVAEQAHERLKGLMGEKTEESIRTGNLLR